MTGTTLARFPGLLAAASLAGGLGCSTSAQSNGASNGCLHGFDGCIAGSVFNADPTPFKPADSARDGKGTFYVALLDQCPTLGTSQFKFISDVAKVENVDFTGSSQYQFTLNFRFNDARYATTYAEGAEAALSGFLDDNQDIFAGGATTPSIGDTAMGCLKIHLTSGPNQLVQPLVPCIVVDPLALGYFTQPLAVGDQCAGFALAGDAGPDAATD